MQTPDPNRSIEYEQPDNFDVDLPDPVPEEFDPLDALLAEEEQPDIDEERLYTDEFIRANESASRSLFLGFLGLALLGTSLVAWFILSQPQDTTTDPSPSSPITVPTSPPENIPDLRLDSNSPEPSAPLSTTPEGQSNPGTAPQQPPLSFPANPATPDISGTPEGVVPGNEPASPDPLENPESSDTPIEALPEGTVPPPPPVAP